MTFLKKKTTKFTTLLYIPVKHKLQVWKLQILVELPKVTVFCREDGYWYIVRLSLVEKTDLLWSFPYLVHVITRLQLQDNIICFSLDTFRQILEDMIWTLNSLLVKIHASLKKLYIPTPTTRTSYPLF